MRGILGLIAVVIPIVGSAQTEEWVARYNGPADSSDKASAIAVDGSGNVYVTGGSAGSGTEHDYATVKYNAAGAEQWVARYDGPGNVDDEAEAIAVDGSGNVYVTGVSVGLGTNWDYATVKYNSSGGEQWVRRYNRPGNDWDGASAIAVDGSGNVYVTGASEGLGTGFDYATVKYNASGGEDWVRRYNGPGNLEDYASAIAVDGSGNVYVTGRSWGSGTSYDYATVKYNSSGAEQWVARYNAPGNWWDGASAIAVDGSGNVYVTGMSLWDYATVKYNASGAEQWVARYDGPDNGGDVAYAIAVDGSGNVYVTGRSVGSGTSFDYATVKYNAAGAEQWVARYNGPGNSSDEARAIAVDRSGSNVYVTGGGYGSGADYDYATVKYSSEGVEENQIPDIKHQILKVYPNPFTAVSSVKWAVPKETHVNLSVYDITGRLVKALVNGKKESGYYTAQWDAKGYPAGVYFVKLQAGDSIKTKKLVLMR